MTATSVPATTIKVSVSTRDAVNALAAEQGTTAGSVVEALVAEHLWRREVEAAKRAMRSSPAEAMREYAEEARSMDASLADGLEPEEW
jgi:predicted outer membrane protein